MYALAWALDRKTACAGLVSTTKLLKITLSGKIFRCRYPARSKFDYKHSIILVSMLQLPIIGRPYGDPC